MRYGVMLLVEFAARTLGQAVAENDAVAVIGFVLQLSLIHISEPTRQVR